MAYPIPDEALDDRLGWVGTSGSGKTYNAAGGVERLLESGARTVIVDPLGVWWGLRLQSNGQPSSHNIVIIGGEHGDLPLNEHAGKLIGETVATAPESFIIDLSQMATKEAERRFMLAFLETWYRKADGDPVHAIFDEADLWAPQGAGSGAGPKLQALMEQIVRRGRVKGFVPWLITQRPAVVSKDVLSQVDGLVALKLTSSQDRKAIGEWVRGQADEGQWKEIWKELPAMQRGQGIVWVPARGILETVSFPKKQTFDSSRTPKRGEKKERRELPPLDIGKLERKLASVEEDMKANDPAALKKEVSSLKRQLTVANRNLEKAETPAPTLAKVEEKAIEAARAEGVAIGIQQAQSALAALAKGKPAPKAMKDNGALPKVEAEPLPVTSQEGISGPQQRILNSLAWWRAFGIDRPSNEQVAFVAGYSPKSGNFGNLKGGLNTSKLITYPRPGQLELTEDGKAKADAPAKPPTQNEMHSRVMAKLKGPQQRILAPAIAAYPDECSNDQLADEAGYSASSGNFGNLKGSLRSLGLIDYPQPGYVRAADWLFVE